MSNIEKKMDVEGIVIDILTELGIPAAVLGHRYLITAISAAVENPSIMDAVTKELYPLIAKKHNTTGSRAERGMRHAIEIAWDRSSLETLDKYFGNTISPNKGKATNSEFIAQLALTIRRMKGVV